MKIYGLLPCAYTHSSNGIVTLCQLYQELEKSVDRNFLFLALQEDSKTTQYYSGIFGEKLLTYHKGHSQAIANELASEPFILIRPDNLEGVKNPVHWILSGMKNHVASLNLLLAPPFVFSEKRSILEYYGPKDFFTIGNQAIMPALALLEDRDCFLESHTRLEQPQGAPTRASSKQIAVYIGKGIAGPIAGLSEALRSQGVELLASNTQYISRSWPVTKEELYKILSGSEILISCDPFSHIEREATMLGTPVLKPNSLNIRELPGVANCIEEIRLSNSYDCRSRLQALAHSDYRAGRKQNTASTTRIATALKELAGEGTHETPSTAIPYSRRLIYAFASQHRAYTAFLADPELTRLTNSLTASDVVEILSGEIKGQLAQDYATKARRRAQQTFTIGTNKTKGRERKPIVYTYSE